MPQVHSPDPFMFENLSYQEILRLKLSVTELRSLFKLLYLTDPYNSQLSMQGMNSSQLDNDLLKLEYFFDAVMSRKQAGGF